MAKTAPKYPIIPNPSTRLFWDDLRGEERLKLVSFAAQGLWAVHMLALMAGSGGYLAFEGEALSIADLAALTGKPIGEVEAAIGELDAKKVFSRDRHGTPYNRRMVKMHAKNEAARKNGRLGGQAKAAKSELSTGDGNFSDPVDNFDRGEDDFASNASCDPIAAKNGRKTPFRKSLNSQDNPDQLTQKSSGPLADRVPRARGFLNSLNQEDLERPLREEKNPASDPEHIPVPGRLNGGKITARILGIAQKSDTPENRAWANRLSLALDSDEGLELTRYETKPGRVAELVRKGQEIMISGSSKN